MQLQTGVTDALCPVRLSQREQLIWCAFPHNSGSYQVRLLSRIVVHPGCWRFFGVFVFCWVKSLAESSFFNWLASFLMKCYHMHFVSMQLFARQGALVSRYPVATLIITVVLLAVMCCGFIHFHVVTDPVELWSDPMSRARLEKKYFDENFG